MISDAYKGISLFFRNGAGVLPLSEQTVIALGTFDGVHIAHKRLLERAVAFKNELGASFCGAFCFSKSPLSYLCGTDVPQICTVEEKLDLMFDAGLDFVAVGDFDAFRDMSAQAFVTDVICGQLGGIGAVCGFNYRFGKGGAGNSQTLCQMLGEQNVIALPKVSIDSVTVSSTAIRDYLASGNVAMANKMLGRAFTLRAKVIPGKRLGRTIGCPTTNQVFPAGAVRLQNGIYATLCTTEDGKTYVGASNIGIRPSIDGDIDDHSLNCETMLADFSHDIYGELLTVEFCEFLRDEMKFSSLDELSAAIRHDLDRAVAHFADKSADK